jgi:hypothetical protein
MYSLGGFEWKAPHLTTKPASPPPRRKKAPQQAPPANRHKAPTEEKESLKHQFDRLRAAIEEQKNTTNIKMVAVKEQLDALGRQIAETVDLLPNHRHPVKIQGTETITGKPVTVTKITRKESRK